MWFCRSEIKAQGCLADSVFTMPESRCRQGCLPSWGPKDDLASKFMQVVGWIRFLAVVGLRSLIPCWLLAGALFQVLEAAHIPWLMAPYLHPQSQQRGAKSFSHLEYFWSLLPHLPNCLCPLSHLSNFSTYKKLCDWIILTWIIQDNLFILILITSAKTFHSSV